MIELKKEEIDRFWSRVAKAEDGCWYWLGATNGIGGYGVVCFYRDRGRVKHQYGSHRVSWFLAHGDPEQLHVLHACDHPSCVNPAHLFLGTEADNMADKVAKGRQARGATHGSRTLPESVPRGEGNGNASLDGDAVVQIRDRFASGASRAALAREFGVDWSTIDAVVRRHTWRHV
jgi:hypothetical protein